MELLVIVFILGYILVALEHSIKIDKAATALFMGISLWVLLVLFNSSHLHLSDSLTHHFAQIAEILFFLLGAMTIVELIDAHHGFNLVQKAIRTKNRIKLLWLISVITFFLSAVLDNLTTTIVMVALIKKFFTEREEQWFFAGFVIIAANAGGAWSPIGDITTIMLWNSGHISSLVIIRDTILPSIACLLLPLSVVSLFPGKKLKEPVIPPSELDEKGIFGGKLILILGVGLLLFVPVFKAFTHLPPYMGMLFSLAILWTITEILHRNKTHELRHPLTVAGTLERIDTPSILFFLGILLAVAALEVNGTLEKVGQFLEHSFNSYYTINSLLGVLSSVVDNVPLVAGAMGMYPKEVYAPDHPFWTLLAYCAGTGGSALIIGSAAGVAAMGLLKIDFMWYLKKISWLALLGYLFGVLVFILTIGFLTN